MTKAAKPLTPAEVLKKEQAKAKREALELTLLQQIRAHKLPEPERQLQFHPERKWKSDFAFRNFGSVLYGMGYLVEVDGGVFTGGRHTRGSGYEKDCEKLAEAALLGWKVIRVTSNHIKSGQAIDWIKRALGDS